MLFLSHLLGKNVRTDDGARVGKVVDLLVTTAEPRPSVTALVAAIGGKKMQLRWEQVKSLDEDAFTVQGEPLPYEEGAEISLRRELLDKQIVDTDGRRVVRVNDVQLSRVADSLRVIGVDIGSRGLLRRMGWERAGEKVARWL